jgi:hypothetical protein
MKKLVHTLSLLSFISLFFSINAQNALDFDGNSDYVDCGNDTSVKITGTQITLEAWIYPTAWSKNVFEGNIINKEYNTSNYGYMLRVGEGGKLNFAFGDGSWNELTSASALLSLNTWQHVAATYDGSKMRLYVDGVAADSSSVTATIKNAYSTSLSIGAHPGLSRYYQGKIDELKIWNICRSESQIYSGLNDEICSVTNGLQAYYKFNQGKASKANGSVKVLTDYSGNGNKGTLNTFTLNGSTSNWVLSQTFKKSLSYGSDTVSSCGSYSSPSKRFLWTSSGVYQDTIASYMDCDSALTIYLTIRKSGSSFIKVYACSSYSSPSGKYTWTKSGIYNDHLQNYLKCDSSIYITLTVGGERDSIYPVVCGSYTSPSGNYTFTKSGYYTDTLVSYQSCDSIVDIFLTVNHASVFNQNVNVCNGYLSSSGKGFYTSTGTYYDTLVNYVSCDSVIITNLKIKKSTGTLTAQNCDSWMPPSGKYTYIQSGNYLDTISNYFGCDSVIAIALTITESSSSSITKSLCRQYISDNNVVYSKSGTYTESYTNSVGCDSVRTLNLTITNLDNTVTQAGEKLTSNSSIGTFKWLDCKNALSPISGATNKVFTATKNGEYAIEITENSCKDTSICYTVDGLSLRDNRIVIQVKIQPNPSNGNLNITLPETYQNVQVQVSDLSGRSVYSACHDSYKTGEVKLEASPGMYIISIQSPEFKATQKIVIE